MAVSAATLRVASIPAGHVYVRHLGDPDGADGVVRLPDLPPADGRKVPGGWWPPVMLDAAWIEAHADEFELMHVHFGFDAKTPAELDAVGRALAAAGRPLVVTVHDLRNPHHDDPALHDAQLRALLGHAAAVLTLTPGAAWEVRERYGRDATVLPHPHVLEVDRLAAARPRRPVDELLVGIHAKSLRANMDVLAVADVLAGRPGVRLRIDVHDEVFEPGHYFHDPQTGAALQALAASRPDTELRVHPYFSDAELWDYLETIDVSVLPYRFGTHSGWLEACHDLGTTVVVPSCGFYAEQRPVLEYTHDESGLDRASLRAAIDRARAEHPLAQATAEARLAERREVAAAHARIYAAVLA